MTRELFNRRIFGILKEFERLKTELPSDLHDELPTNADNIRDMMVYGFDYRNKMDDAWQPVENYFIYFTETDIK